MLSDKEFFLKLKQYIEDVEHQIDGEWMPDLYFQVLQRITSLAQPEPVWTEGICGDGAAILNDGVMQPIEDVVAALNATALAQPEHPSDGGLTVSLRMDLSSECLKRLCDGLAAAVKPNGGYREITTDDDIASGFTGDQQVGVTWWLPEHGCDSLENTLDAIKGRLLVAVRNWLPTAVAATTTIKPVPVAERPWEREGWCDDNGWCWGFDADDTDPCWVFDKPESWSCWTHSLPHNALPLPTPLENP